MYSNLQEYLETAIDNCRVTENAVRRAFFDNGDYLWIQLGGPVKASRIRNEALSDRLWLMDIYEKIYGQEHLPNAFNEF